MTYIKVFLIAIIIFLILDFIWLGLVAKNLYQNEIGTLLKTKFNFVAAFIFYIIFIIALTIFVIIPAINNNSLKEVILLGAIFGLVTYATYDLTNFATLEGFTIKIVIIDLLWGTTLGTLTSTLTYLIYKGVFTWLTI